MAERVLVGGVEGPSGSRIHHHGREARPVHQGSVPGAVVPRFAVTAARAGVVVAGLGLTGGSHNRDRDRHGRQALLPHGTDMTRHTSILAAGSALARGDEMTGGAARDPNATRMEAMGSQLRRG